MNKHTLVERNFLSMQKENVIQQWPLWHYFRRQSAEETGRIRESAKAANWTRQKGQRPSRCTCSQQSIHFAIHLGTKFTSWETQTQILVCHCKNHFTFTSQQGSQEETWELCGINSLILGFSPSLLPAPVILLSGIKRSCASLCNTLYTPSCAWMPDNMNIP